MISENILNNKRNVGNLSVSFFWIVSVLERYSLNSFSQPGYLNKKNIRLGNFLYSDIISFFQFGFVIKKISSKITFLTFSGIIFVMLKSGIIKDFENSSENPSSSSISPGIKSIISLKLFSFSSTHNKYLNKLLINSNKYACAWE